MYIHRIILRDVKSIDHLDVTLHDDWRNEPLKSILLTGPNGSGKTTILRVIAALWENFGKWLAKGSSLTETEARTGVLENAGYAALEIHDLAPSPVCIFVFRDLHHYKELEGLITPGTVMLKNASGWSELIRPASIEQWYELFRKQRERLITIGSDTDLIPNLLYIDAETRFIPPPKDKKPSDFERYYEWLVTYPFVTDNYGDLNRLLSNLKIRKPEWFYDFVKQVNGFFGEKKRLTDFDFSSLRLKVEANHGSDKFHYIEDLSSGEQQYILLMYLASRWLMPGGIMLVDEPDLHLHASLQRYFIHELEKVVLSKNGQLIVTSHSHMIWEEFRREGQRIELREKLAL